MNKHYDFFVIGAGSGGVRAARIASTHGAKVGIAEAQYLGGTCVNVGCIPKKLMAYAADYGIGFEDARGYGWQIEEPVLDWNAFMARKNAEIQRLNGIYKNVLEKNNVTIHYGFAKFVDAHTLDINGETITADKILIATGGKPKRLDIEGAEHVITSDETFYFKELPKHAVIYGAGYIALEFVHILHGLGAQVTLIYRGGFLRSFDADIRTALLQELQKQGVTVLPETKILKVEPGMKVHTSQGSIIECDTVLSAVGREPNTQNLNLEALGITCDGCKIITDKYNRTNVDNIYAIGDATHTMELTPVAIAEGHALADRLFGGSERMVDLTHTPTAAFSYPPVSMVGLTEEKAREKGFEVQIFKSDFKPLKHTISARDERAFMKLVVDKITNKVLGLHMMGLDAPEIMQGFAVALSAGATKADFDRTIGIHPTAAEEFVQMRTPSSS